jgi:hypothetical protein
MSRDDAYELMRDVLKGLLPSLERVARTAKNAPGRKQLMAQIDQVRQALRAAEEASREARIPPGAESSATLPGSEAS